MASKHTKFKELLKLKLVFSEEYKLSDIARKMNVPISTLYHYTEEAAPHFPVELIAPLYNATKDIEFLNFILADTDFMLSPRQQQSTEPKSVKDEALEAAAAGGVLVKQVCEALRNGALSDEEKSLIVKAIDNAELELEDLRLSVRHAGGNGKG